MLGQGFGFAGASSTFDDQITIVLPSGYAGSTVHVVMSAHVNASVKDTGSGSGEYATVSSYIRAVPSIFSSYSSYFCDNSPDAGPCSPGTTSPDLSIAFDLPVSNLSFHFYDHLDVGSHGTATADAAHTSLLSITLPEGVSFTSDSGVLLSQVPEPSSLLLFGTLLTAFGGLRRRRYSTH